MIRGAVFDFDETLAEALDAFIDCYQSASKSVGLPPPSDEDVGKLIGTPVPIGFTILYPHEDSSKADAFTQAFMRRADEIMVDKTSMLTGVPDTLRALHNAGIGLGIVSQKLRWRLEAVLQREELLDCFGAIIGGDDMPAFKPDPRGLLLAIERLGAQPNEALFVGDTPIDGETAQRAGVGFIPVLTGFYTEADFAPYTPVAVLGSVNELPAYLEIKKD